MRNMGVDRCDASSRARISWRLLCPAPSTGADATGPSSPPPRALVGCRHLDTVRERRTVPARLPNRRVLAVAAASALVGAGALVAGAGPAVGAPVSETFSEPGFDAQALEVPAGICFVTVEARGGSGGSGGGGTAGEG